MYINVFFLKFNAVITLILLMSIMVTGSTTVMHFKDDAKAGKAVDCSFSYIYDKSTHEDLLN
ncbi:hypothetical protein RMATCC62417_04197 [Rhizopus microsporus]|nr:hypothetical protein RMATCC62417_04197 [Rhizopus microsporus]